jgi:hypothetical protein
MSKPSLIITTATGAALAIDGILAGFLPLSSMGADCGSAFAPEAYGAEEVCSGPIANWRLIAILLIVTGIVIFAAAAAVMAKYYPWTPDKPPAQRGPATGPPPP